MDAMETKIFQKNPMPIQGTPQVENHCSMKLLAMREVHATQEKIALAEFVVNLKDLKMESFCSCF